MGEFRMPSLGAEMEAGKVVEWKIKPGDQVKRGDIVAVIDTDKAAVEVEIWETGVVEALLVQPGDRVPVGTPLARIRGEKEAVAAPVAAPSAGAAPAAGLRASPAAKKRAQELGVKLEGLKGTGPDGALTISDIEAAAQLGRSIPKPETTPPPGGAAPAEDRGAAMRRAIAAAMARSKKEIPHYYLSKRIDLKRASAWLEAENKKRAVTDRILPVVPLLRATALACRKFPELNGHWVNDRFEAAAHVNLGVAISIRGGGLIAPAILEAESKNLDALMASLRDLVGRARAGSIRSSELGEGTVTVSNLGESGAETLFGVIYPPQVALVGFGAVYRAAAEGAGGAVELRPFLNATVAGDHRASDGHRGALFLGAIEQCLQDPEKLS